MSGTGTRTSHDTWILQLCVDFIHMNHGRALAIVRALLTLILEDRAFLVLASNRFKPSDFHTILVI